ncbi:hypothetical protein C8R41DRAFT_497139 [Lentinula lateritia]|uniref:Uncharacterized protein n=1 Tax=Lentinula lateritia TaxID=40482 RepID=A0ABQ8V898_9AGAR|nr:hypothetical protein C8R41DRAFT_497139 [Lentinula lateritia]
MKSSACWTIDTMGVYTKINHNLVLLYSHIGCHRRFPNVFRIQPSIISITHASLIYPDMIVSNANPVHDGLPVPPTNSYTMNSYNFEGEIHRITSIQVALVEADMYLWDGKADLISGETWSEDLVNGPIFCERG